MAAIISLGIGKSKLSFEFLGFMENEEEKIAL